MGAVIDGKRSNTAGAGAFRQDRKTEFEGCIGKAVLGINLDDGGPLLRQQFGLSDRIDLASLNGAQRAFDPVDAMRFAGVPFGGNDHAGDRCGL